jgi:hypothetical protein
VLVHAIVPSNPSRSPLSRSPKRKIAKISVKLYFFANFQSLFSELQDFPEQRGGYQIKDSKWVTVISHNFQANHCGAVGAEIYYEI